MALLTLFILLAWISTCVYAQNSNNGDLPTDCVQQKGVVPWWSPLQTAAGGLNPCQLHQHLLLQHKLDFLCCQNGTPQPKRSSGDASNTCAPCNVPTFNMEAACHACQVGTNATPTDAQLQGSPHNMFSQWKKGGGSTEPLTQFSVHWLHTPLVNNSTFDLASVLKTAKESKPFGSGNHSPDDDGPSSSTSPPLAASTAPDSSNSSSSNAGVIVGGVVGGIVIICLAIIAVILLRRHRRARFEFVEPRRPRDPYMFSGRESDSLPPFSRGEWKYPIGEKIHSPAGGQSEYGTEIFSSVYSV